MIGKLQNQPNLKLHGSTWDAKHLDQFLHSQWGDKLFNTSTSIPIPRTNNNSRSFAIPTSGTLKPSPQFISQPRESKAPQTLTPDKGPMALLDHYTHSSFFPTKAPDPSRVSTKMHQLKSQIQKQEKVQFQRMTPSKRRHLVNINKSMQQQYNALKKERLQSIKKQRIIKNIFPNGILGVDSPNQQSQSILYKKDQEQARKRARQEQEKKVYRIDSFQKFRYTSHQLYHGVSTSLPEKPRGLKFVHQNPRHYHDTYSSLFEASSPKQNLLRTQKLKQEWRSNRNFNILSGAYFKDQKFRVSRSQHFVLGFGQASRGKELTLCCRKSLFILVLLVYLPMLYGLIGNLLIFWPASNTPFNIY